jgi:hypothetical protein
MNGKGVWIVVAAILAGCSDPSSDSGETQRRIGLCQQVMKKYIIEAKTYERDQQRLIASCQISQKDRSIEQWQCVLDAVDKGEKYAEASDKCGRLSPAPKN